MDMLTRSAQYDGTSPDFGTAIVEPSALQAARSRADVPVQERAAPRAPLDLESLWHRCSGDTRCCTMLLHKFVTHAGDQIAMLKRATKSGNAIELAARAHTLKEVAANLSADDLQFHCSELEWLAEDGKLDHVGPVLERIEGEVQRCLEALPELLTQIRR